MTPYYEDATVTVHAGDCLDILAELPDVSVDAVVTDPPYLLGFMGREWDTKAAHEHLSWHLAWATHAFRVLKPGGHLLAFGGTRTSHRLACAIEDAGFEIRDSIAWLYGSGFPKSLDVSKAIDKAAGAEREETGRVLSVTGNRSTPSSAMVTTGLGAVNVGPQEHRETAPATEAARTWQGWGTALKPAHEPIVVARKTLAGTVAANVLAHGTGALNVDGCRVEGEVPSVPQPVYGVKSDGVTNFGSGEGRNGQMSSAPGGRWPANVVLDETQAEALDQQSGELVTHAGTYRRDQATGVRSSYQLDPTAGHVTSTGDSGGASRFFYVAKADATERVRINGVAHPTVKPLALMRWLVRLVTPPGGTVLEPFAGSGTTVEACILEGFRCVAIERDETYLPLIRQRIHKRRDPVEAVRAVAAEDMGLFGELDEGA